MESTEHERQAQGRRAERPAEGISPRRGAAGEVLGAHATAQLEEIEALVNLGRWIWDVESGSITCSPQLIRIFGLASPDLMPNSNSFLLRVHQADRMRVRASIMRACPRPAQAYTTPTCRANSAAPHRPRARPYGPFAVITTDGAERSAAPWNTASTLLPSGSRTNAP